MVHDFSLPLSFSFLQMETNKDGQVQKKLNGVKRDGDGFILSALYVTPPNKKRTRKKCAQSQCLNSCLYIYMHNISQNRALSSFQVRAGR